MQVSLVMFYGPKPAPLRSLILECQKRLHAVLGAGFQPYAVEQVHATLIALERAPGPGLRNLFLTQLAGADQPEMELSALLAFLREGGGGLLPLRIQVGGFADGHDYGFRSRNLHPALRSVSIANKKP